MPSLCFTTVDRGWRGRDTPLEIQTCEPSGNKVPEPNLEVGDSDPGQSQSLQTGVSATHFSWGEGCKSFDGDLVVWADLVVVSGVLEGQGQHSLFLQICLYREKERKKFS